LHKRRYDPRGSVVEVYDYPQPTSGIEVATIEMLAARNCVVRTLVRMGDRSEDKVSLVHEVRPTEREMKARTGVKYDHTTVGVSGAGMVLSHP
jgi:hypothetical protein